jgi:hypothetical protein
MAQAKQPKNKGSAKSKSSTTVKSTAKANKTVPKASKLECSKCSFKAKNAGGLTTHVNAKHRKGAPARATGKSTAHQRGKAKIDWNKAYEWFIADHTRSYSDVAKQFGVTKKSVENNAKYVYTEGDEKGTWCTWAERRRELGEIARKNAEDEYKKSAPFREEQHLIQYRNAQILASQKIAMMSKEGTWLVDPKTQQRFKVNEISGRDIKDIIVGLRSAIDGERIIMGLPTSVSTIKPGDSEKGMGWTELLMMAMARVEQEGKPKDGSEPPSA